MWKYGAHVAVILFQSFEVEMGVRYWNLDNLHNPLEFFLFSYLVAADDDMKISSTRSWHNVHY